MLSTIQSSELPELKKTETIEKNILIRWFVTATSGTKPIIVSTGHVYIFLHQERNEEVPFSMAIGNGELMPECFPIHSRMGTARMK